MLYALDEHGRRVTATPGATAVCPQCEAPVIAKTGRIVTWHWAHQSLEDCDPWSEPETRWHLSWKRLLSRDTPAGPACMVEQVITRDGETHRADVVNPAGRVLELQHSSISPADIEARERFYGRMWWLFDAREPYASDRLRLPRKVAEPNTYTFQWLHPKKSLIYVKQPLYLQLDGVRVFRVRKIGLDKRLFGWGELLTTPLFSHLVRWSGT